jgi:hypothetical protein
LPTNNPSADQTLVGAVNCLLVAATNDNCDNDTAARRKMISVPIFTAPVVLLVVSFAASISVCGGVARQQQLRQAAEADFIGWSGET